MTFLDAEQKFLGFLKSPWTLRVLTIVVGTAAAVDVAVSYALPAWQKLIKFVVLEGAALGIGTSLPTKKLDNP